jgi:anthranilate/para-aminobenzoate synthase component I
LAHRPGFALLWSATGGPSYLACDPLQASNALDPEPELALGSGPAARDLERAPRWIGLLPYEARRGLERHSEPDPRPEPHCPRPVWHRYGAVVEVTSEGARVIGDDLDRVRELQGRLGAAAAELEAPRIELAEPVEAPERHVARVRRALEHIAKGDVYVINLARRFRFAVQGHPLAILEASSRHAPAPYAAALRFGELDVVSTSPELFLATEPGGRVETWPIKGTRPRGSDAPRDAELERDLDRDPKERAELAMVIDVERNDLGRVAERGSVRLLGAVRVETRGNVHHRVARVAARLAPGTSRTALLEAMLPSGSVTGAPKIRAMELSAGLEPHRRGLYTGALGFLRHDGSLVLAMAIRTLTVVGGDGHYFAGGGIVADSDPERETEETLWKARQVLAHVRSG